MTETRDLRVLSPERKKQFLFLLVLGFRVVILIEHKVKYFKPFLFCDDYGLNKCSNVEIFLFQFSMMTKITVVNYSRHFS